MVRSLDFMKPSPSSSSPSSYGGQSGRATSNCLSRILRRILRFSNLPLCSLDQFKVDEGENSVAISAPDATPGVVARLMGLDSVPPAEPVKAPRRPRTRRARDILPYRQLEDDKFIILSFEKRDTRKMKASSRRIGDGSNVKRGRSRRENKENEDPANLNNPIEKSKKKLARKDSFAEAMMLEYEGDSEHSSPNSVLEYERFSADQEFLSPGEISRRENSRTRRPLSEDLENCEDSEGKLRIASGGENLVKSKKKQPKCAGKWGEIGKLAAMEEELMMNNKHCVLEIGGDVASSIFDHLLEELVLNLNHF